VAIRIGPGEGHLDPPGTGWRDVVRDNDHGLAVSERGG
jgi:hypothetical protein